MIRMGSIRLGAGCCRWSSGLALVLAGIGAAAQPVLPPAAPASAPSGEPVLRIEAGMHGAPIERIDVDAAGRYAVTASPDKTARVWDIASGRLLQILRPPIGPGNEGKLNAAAITPDGSVVATAGHTGGSWNRLMQIYLFDRASGRLLRRLGDLPGAVRHLSFSADGRWLAASLTTGTGGSLQVWDWQRSASPQSDRDFRAPSWHLAFSRDGRLAATAYDGLVRLYTLDDDRLRRVALQQAPGGKTPAAVAFSPDGARLALGYEDAPRVDLLDGRTLAPLAPLPAPDHAIGYLSAVAYSADGRTVLGAGLRDRVSRNIAYRWAATGQDAPLATTGSFFSVPNIVPLPQGGWLLAASNPMWGRFSAEGRWQPLGVSPLADTRFARGTAFQLAEGGWSVQFGYLPHGREPHRFDLRNRSLAAGTLTGGQAPRSTGLDVAGYAEQPAPTLAGRPLPMLPGELARAAVVAPDNAGFLLGSDYRLRRFSAEGRQVWVRPMPAFNTGLNMPLDGPLAAKVFVAAYGDGTIRWHRYGDGQELLALFAHADRRRWVLWTPSGYFDASAGADELIGWHLNRGQDEAADFFPVSRLRNRFFRPDVIDRVLDTLDEAEALKQADQATNRRQEATVSVARLLPPVVELLSPADVGTTSPQVTLRVRGRSAADAPVTQWRVRVDGQLAVGIRGATPVAAGGDAHEIVVPVPPRDSEIQVFAENRHGVSVPGTVRVRWSGGTDRSDAPAAMRQPKLYVLAVGVGRYAHKDIGALAYAAKDARDFAAAMQRQQGRLYGEVEVRLLTDAQATRDDIIDGLDWLQKQVTQHDVGMLFFAGHGINDPALGYTFLPANAEPERLKRSGVGMADVRSTLSSLAGKALFFFDTCHAGNVLGEGRRGLANDLSGVINDLAGTENGVVVFSSSTGRQYSYENPAWNNGAFTLALVEGLNGAAAQADGPRITHKMLDYYVSDRVKRLTEGRQTPVTQAPGGVPDFPVAVK
jgi:Caspase domain/WD domain, G-beta repeat